MRASLLLPVLLACLTLGAQDAKPRLYRQWIAGEEVGGASKAIRREGPDQVVESREWLSLTRMGMTIRQELDETARRRPDGSLAFTWRVKLSQEPFEGVAEWSPLAPGILKIRPKHGSPVEKPVPEGAILWPEDLDARLQAAAKSGRPVRAVTFSFPAQQWSTVELEPKGRDPLPGFPDAVHFSGREIDGDTQAPLESWISPTEGEVRQTSDLGGLSLLMQRRELPAPAAAGTPAAGFFERTLQTLPPHPFLPWLKEITLRAEGADPALKEDAQQHRLPDGRWRFVRAAMPSAAEAAEPPVTGRPSAADAPYLAATPLVPFRDPAFDGLLRRMALPQGLSRWELAQRVTDFVFTWITDKDFSVGFASALEVCHHPRGDCTEHGVLAVALLRRLGVPARGVTGWVALDGMLGLHFWVEVELGHRWVPVDPTFDQAPASAFRIKLGDSDLADLGSVGWEGAAMAFTGVRWVPADQGPRAWGTDVRVAGDQVAGPDGLRLRLPGARWTWRDGHLDVHPAQGGSWTVQAAIRPGEAQLKGAHHLAGAKTLRKGWWDPVSRTLWMGLPHRRWLTIAGPSEAEAFDLLDQMEVASGTPG